MSLTRCLEKRGISTVSEFDEIGWGNYISLYKFNGEVCFIIRELENFRFPIEITVLPLFKKIEFFPGFTRGVGRSGLKVEFDGGEREKGEKGWGQLDSDMW